MTTVEMYKVSISHTNFLLSFCNQLDYTVLHSQAKTELFLSLQFAFIFTRVSHFLAFWVWFLFLGRMQLRFIHVVCITSLVLYCWVVFQRCIIVCLPVSQWRYIQVVSRCLLLWKNLLNICIWIVLTGFLMYRYLGGDGWVIWQVCINL